MASIRKRGNSYLIVVSMGYDYEGNRIKPVQKTVKPPQGLTPKQTERWLSEQALIFEQQAKNEPQPIDRGITLAKYIELWLEEIAPHKLSKSTLVRDKQDIYRILPHLGHYKLAELRPEHFRGFYDLMRTKENRQRGGLLSEATIEGMHATLCGILTSAMEQGYISHNPAWRTYKYSGLKKQKIIADEEMVERLIAALEQESLKYELYFKLLIATGMRRGECCGLKWCDLNFENRTIQIRRNVVKVTGEEIFTKEPKTAAGNRTVYFSLEMASLFEEYRRECIWRLDAYEGRELSEEDYIFKKQGEPLPMTPSSFTWRFKLILKKNGLPEKLNVHSLRHTNASLLIAQGADVATVAGLLGHSQPSTTLDIYSHAFDKNKKKASEELHSVLEL